jgi:hypothetical protein
MNPHCLKQPPPEIYKRTHLPDSIPIHIKDALTRCIPDAIMYEYDCKEGTHQYILIEIKYCRDDTDPDKQQDRALQQHQVLKETILKYAPQATVVDQVTLLLGVSVGAIYSSFIATMKDKLGVTQPRPNTLLTKLHYMAVITS